MYLLPIQTFVVTRPATTGTIVTRGIVVPMERHGIATPRSVSPLLVTLLILALETRSATTKSSRAKHLRRALISDAKTRAHPRALTLRVPNIIPATPVPVHVVPQVPSTMARNVFLWHAKPVLVPVARNVSPHHNSASRPLVHNTSVWMTQLRIHATVYLVTTATHAAQGIAVPMELLIIPKSTYA